MLKKVSIRIIDKDFNFLGEIDNYESLQFIRRFYKVGEFELHINMDKANTDILVKNNLIILGNNLNKVGIIMHRESQIKGDGTDELIIRGPTLKGVMSRRIIVPPVDSDGYDSQTGSQETIMKAFVGNHVVNPTDADRKIPQIEIATDQQRGSQDKWRSKFEILSDKLEEIGTYANMGWDVVLDTDNNKWLFDVYIGRDLTVDQEILPPVIFSTSFDNILTPHLIQSLLNTANVGYAGGKGDDEDRLVQKIGSSTGFERLEAFLDCSQAEDITELTSQGQQKLNEIKEVQTFEFQIIPDNTFIYGQDYDLGDFVTAQSKKWELTMNCQIIEIKENYEVDGFTIETTLGNNIPNLLTTIKKMKNNQVNINTTIRSPLEMDVVDGGNF